jgi:hypothetical protein
VIAIIFASGGDASARAAKAAAATIPIVWSKMTPQETCAALNCCCAKWTVEPYFAGRIILL